MKTLKENPITRELHQFWRDEIKQTLNISTSFLSPIKYVESTPQKFYCRHAFDAYSQFLNKVVASDPKLLNKLLNEHEQELSLANITIEEINSKPIHDIHLSRDIELLEFIRSQIHFNLLNLYEAGLGGLLTVPAKLSRSGRNKSVDGLELFTIIEEMKFTNLSFVSDLYNSTIRNSVAHGKVVFGDHDVHYTDKKGNTTRLGYREVVKLFDRVVDAVNGFYLALKLFLYEQNSTVSIPLSVLTEELKITCQSPGWEVRDCFETVAIGKRRQLSIYVLNENWAYMKVLYYSFFTAYWADLLIKNYDRIFITLKSTTAPPGWAAFDARKLAEVRASESQNIEELKFALENGGIMFHPTRKFPSLFYKLGSLRAAFSLVWKARRLKNKQSSPNRIIVRDVYFDVRRSTIVISDASVVVEFGSFLDKATYIEAQYALIVKNVIRHCRKQLKSFRRLFQVEYIQVSVFDSDQRVRNVRHSGLNENTIASIRVNSSKTIKVPDLVHSEIEQHGRYTIYWNNAWRYNNLDNKQYESEN